MIDTGVASKVPSTEPLPYAVAGSKGEKSGEQGFSQTLDHVSHKDQQHQAPKSDASAAGEAGSDADEAALTEAGLPGSDKPKPTIDIRFTLTRGQMNAEDAGEKAAAEGVRSGFARPTEGGKGKKTGHAAMTEATAAEGKEKADAADLFAQQAGADAVAKEEDSLGQMLSMLMSRDEGAVAPLASADDADLQRVGKGKASAADGIAAMAGVLDLAGKSQIGADGGDMSGEGGDTGKGFRLVRADGKGQSLALMVDENGTQSSSDRSGVGKDGGPTVTLVEERRFIAPISTSNAANISAAVLGDSEWVNAMRSAQDAAGVDPSQSAAGKVVNTLKIQMSPIELGLVTANLRLIGETLSVHLTVENHAALRKLNEDQSDIIKALQSQGFAVDSVQVSLAARPDQGAQADQQQASGQGAAQQNGSQGGLPGEQRQGGDGGPGFSSAMGMNGNDDTASAAAPRGASDTGRSGDLYL